MTSTDHILSAFLRAVLLQMKRLGLNQTTLAKRLKVSRPYVTKVLHGDVNISFGAALRLAKALEMDFVPTLKPRVARVPPDNDCEQSTECQSPKSFSRS